MFTQREAAYQAAFLELATQLVPLGIEPGEIGWAPYGGCLVWLPVPGVPDGEWPVITNHLQVLYAPNFLGGYWGCAHLWDDFDPDNPESMHYPWAVEPDEAADMAVGWISRQLRRPLVREEWDRKLLGGATRWVLTDTGRVVGRRGRLSARRRSRPDRLIHIAPRDG